MLARFKEGAVPKQSRISIAISFALSCATTVLCMIDFHATWFIWILGVSAAGAFAYALIEWWRPWYKEEAVRIEPPKQSTGPTLIKNRGKVGELKMNTISGFSTLVDNDGEIGKTEATNIKAKQAKSDDGKDKINSTK
jgi:hypothetical protein